MSDKENISAKYKNYSNTLKPKRYFIELAELGLLDEYLNTIFLDKFQNDEKFREDMTRILLENSGSSSPILEGLYLENICESLGYFLEYTKQWRIPKH
jgi:hypothetical protein